MPDEAGPLNVFCAVYLDGIDTMIQMPQGNGICLLMGSQLTVDNESAVHCVKPQT